MTDFTILPFNTGNCGIEQYSAALTIGVYLMAVLLLLWPWSSLIKRNALTEHYRLAFVLVILIGIVTSFAYLHDLNFDKANEQVLQNPLSLLTFAHPANASVCLDVQEQKIHGYVEIGHIVSAVLVLLSIILVQVEYRSAQRRFVKNTSTNKISLPFLNIFIILATLFILYEIVIILVNAKILKQFT